MISQNAAQERTVFLVDDDRHFRAVVASWLRDERVHIEEYETGEDSLVALGHKIPGLVVLDLDMPGIGGYETLRRIRATNRFLPVIVLTQSDDVETIVGIMKLGAYDFLRKPPDRSKLLNAINNSLEAHHMSLRLAQLEREVDGRGFPGIVGRSRQMRELYQQIERLAAIDISVYIHGESGTGKELVARAIHEHSGRSKGPFVALNCAAIPESLQESELFGHEKGAFTGAHARHIGKFELAHGGTLFLDELAELSPSLQSKLLRVLQERRFQRVGGTEEVETDFRLISATHRVLRDEVKAGRFREDLFFRIVVFELELPPLRRRPDDIPLLVEHFMDKHAEKLVQRMPSVSSEVMERLVRYGWPGNVRELENAVQRAIVSSGGEEILAQDLPPSVREATDADIAATEAEAEAAFSGGVLAPPATPGAGVQPGSTSDVMVALPGLSLEEIERRAIEMSMRRHDGRISKVVDELKIGRTTLYRKLKGYGLK